jgi:hypothetical protein
MTAWPGRPMMRLKSAWRFAGRRHGLVAGFYRWDVWPGIGRRENRRFGSRIGTGTFIVDQADRAGTSRVRPAAARAKAPRIGPPHLG